MRTRCRSVWPNTPRFGGARVVVLGLGEWQYVHFSTLEPPLMPAEYGLEFFAPGSFRDAVARLLLRISPDDASANIHKNTIDPFAALFEASCGDMSIDRWLVHERQRQRNKSLTNALGEFHQTLIGLLPGWQNQGATGGGVDLIHPEPFGALQRPALVELKNKHNTLSASGRVSVYSDLEKWLSMPAYKSYVAYLVQVIPRSGQRVDEPFEPSGKGRREQIRLMDARTLYTLSTGDPGAFRRVFEAIPFALADVLHSGQIVDAFVGNVALEDLFQRAFPGA